MSKVRIALIGAGQRGKDVYGDYALRYPDEVEFVAVAEPNKLKREEFSKKHKIDNEYQFESWEQLLDKPKFCDAMIVATSDDMHFEPAKKSLELGYHLLLEKPMSNNPKECMELGRIAKKTDKTFMISHVLRYTPFFNSIKKAIDAGRIGKVLSIQHNENIGYYHFGHSFVRGNWRNSDETSPLILQKSCHDMDILLWLVGKKCTKISAFGELSYFKSENQPKGAANRCLDCKVEEECPFSAKKLYYKYIGGWPTSVISEIQTEEAVTEALKKGPYGRCVFKCDNNVADHMAVAIEFENGVNATFTLSAFTKEITRTIKVMGTEGELRAHMGKNVIEISRFDSNEKSVFKPQVVKGGHGGGDYGLMKDFVTLVSSNGNGKALTSADVSVQSHMMAFAAEESRLSHKTIDIDQFSKLY